MIQGSKEITVHGVDHDALHWRRYSLENAIFLRSDITISIRGYFGYLTSNIGVAIKKMDKSFNCYEYKYK